MSEPWEDFANAPVATQEGPWNDFQKTEAGPWNDFQKKQTPDTLKKAGFAFNEALSAATAGPAKALERLTDSGPARRTFAAHEAAAIEAGEHPELFQTSAQPGPDNVLQFPTAGSAEERLQQIQGERRQLGTELRQAPFQALRQGAEDVAGEFGALRQATPGNESVAKVAEVAGGALPFVAEATLPIIGPELAALHGGLDSMGNTWQSAYDYFKAQGMTEDAAKARADSVAAKTGLGTAAVFSALPGGSQAAQSTIMEALKRTGMAGVKAGTVMAADTAQRLMQAKASYRPDLSTGEAIKEIASSMAAGTGLGLVLHGATELKAESGKQKAEREEFSQFGGDVAPTQESPSVQTSGAPEISGVAEATGEPATLPAAEATSVAGTTESRPLSLTEEKYLKEDLGAGRPVPASLIERAGWQDVMRPGYQREGDQYVYTEPERKLTPEQQMVQQNIEAMAELRKQKAESAATEVEVIPAVPNFINVETPAGKRRVVVRAHEDEGGGGWRVGKITVHNDETGSYEMFHPPREGKRFSTPEEATLAGQSLAREALSRPGITAPPERPQPDEFGGLPIGERAPDILDWIEGNYTKPVHFDSPADYGDYVRQYEDRLKGLKPKQREIVQNRRNGFLSLKQGEKADQVLKAMHDEGVYLRIETPDDLANAMLRATESRLKYQEDVSKPVVYPEHVDESLQPFETGEDYRLLEPATIGRLDREARRVHGASYADLERWQQDAIRQVVEARGEVRGREQPGVPERRLDNPTGEQHRPSGGAERPTEPQDQLQRPSPTTAEESLARARRAQQQRDYRQRLRDALPDRYYNARKTFLENRLQNLENAVAILRPQAMAAREALLGEGGDISLNKLKADPERATALFHYEQARDEINQTKIELARLSQTIYPGAESHVQRWLDRLDELKLDTKGQLHAFGLLPEAWNTLIDGVKLAVKGGQKLAEAIDWAISQVKAKFPGVAFDDAGARQHLLDTLGERATGQKILGSTEVSNETKQAVDEYLYQRRSMASDEDTAAAIVQHFGMDQSQQVLLDPPAALPGAVRSKLLGEVTRGLRDQERLARAQGKTAQADALAERQGKLWDDMLPRITDMAQSLAAMRDIIDMTPEGHVARVKRMLDRKAGQDIDAKRPEIEQIKQALEQGRQEGIERVRHDKDANDAAAGAVAAATEGSAETHRAVVMDLAEPWAQSDRILQMARDQVRSKVDELLNKQPAPARGPQVLRTMMDDLAKRAASIAAGFFQGQALHKDGLTGLFKERLGLDQEHANRLAKGMEAEFERQVRDAKKELPKRIRAIQAEQKKNGGLTLDANDRTVDGAIRRQLRDLNVKLGQAIKAAPGQLDAHGKHVAERIVDASGLTGEAADVLRTRLQNRWDALVTDAQRRALETLQKRTGVVVSKPLRDMFGRLVELDRMGALTSERFFDVVKQALKLKTLDAAEAKQIREMVQKAQELPEGWQREQAAAELLQHTERLAGKQRWWDIPMAMFYANILSGVTTPAKIVFENSNLLVANTISEFLSKPVTNLRHPVDFVSDLAGAYKRGIVKGGLQAQGMLRSGVLTGVWQRGRISVLEGRPFGRFEPLNVWKYIFRAIGTAHELTFKPAWEMKQQLIAREVARREGLRGPALDQRVADLMGNTADAVAKARGQAIAETAALNKSGLGARLDIWRRTREIIEQRREQTMPGSTERARDFALRSAYLNEPYGYLGLIATAVRTGLEKGRKEFPIVGTLAKTQIPFTTVVANILNEKMNWTPIGAVRAAMSLRTGELYGRPIQASDERVALLAKAVVGTVALGVMAEMFGDKIHGNGPASPQKRKQLQAQGWIPHSVEYGGRYYSYMNTPAALGMAVIGNWKDWHRYGKADDADGASRMAFAAKATANAIVSQGMLDSLRRLFESLGSENTSEGGNKLEKLAARTASSFVVPNAVQQLDRIFDPTVYDQTGIGSLLQSQIPFVRRENRPVLNVLGEPVQSGPFHYWASKQSEDPVWRMLAEKGVFIPEPSKGMIVGSKTLGPEYYRAVTPDEYYELVKESGPAIRKELVNQLPVLKTLDGPAAQAVITRIANTYHEAAKAKLTK
jgi:hypothetical protein